MPYQNLFQVSVPECTGGATHSESPAAHKVRVLVCFLGFLAEQTQAPSFYLLCVSVQIHWVSGKERGGSWWILTKSCVQPQHREERTWNWSCRGVCSSQLILLPLSPRAVLTGTFPALSWCRRWELSSPWGLAGFSWVSPPCWLLQEEPSPGPTGLWCHSPACPCSTLLVNPHCEEVSDTSTAKVSQSNLC